MGNCLVQKIKIIIVLIILITVSIGLPAQVIRNNIPVINWPMDNYNNSLQEPEIGIERYRLTETLIERWFDYSWTAYVKWTYSYYHDWIQDKTFYLEWNGDSWNNKNKWFYVYDPDGDNIESYWQIWEEEDWQNYSKIAYTYDTLGLKNEEIIYSWIAGKWNNALKYAYSYDSIGKNISLWQQVWENEEWINRVKFDYSYHKINGKLEEELIQIWDEQQWKLFERWIFIYNDIGINTEKIFHEWLYNDWLNLFRVKFTYDEYGNQVEEVWQTWDLDDNWEDNYRYLDEYDSGGKRTSRLTQNSNYGSWVNYQNNIYSYELYTELNDIIQNNSFSLNNYPNPFNSITTIQFNLTKQSVVNLNIYNSNGELIKTIINNEILAIGKHAYSWDGNAENSNKLPTGVYYYTINSGGIYCSNKCLLIY